jgi:formate/nitrite transporter FocA (FNT family)
MSKLKDLILAIMAGIFIGLAGSIYLKVDDKILGAFLFSLGLFAVCTMATICLLEKWPTFFTTKEGPT